MYVPPFDSLPKAKGVPAAELEHWTKVSGPTELSKRRSVFVSNDHFSGQGNRNRRPEGAGSTRGGSTQDPRVHPVGYGLRESGDRPEIVEPWCLSAHLDGADGLRFSRIESGQFGDRLRLRASQSRCCPQRKCRSVEGFLQRAGV